MKKKVITAALATTAMMSYLTLNAQADEVKSTTDVATQQVPTATEANQTPTVTKAEATEKLAGVPEIKVTPEFTAAYKAAITKVGIQGGWTAQDIPDKLPEAVALEQAANQVREINGFNTDKSYGGYGMGYQVARDENGNTKRDQDGKTMFEPTMVGYTPTKHDLATTMTLATMTDEQRHELGQFTALIINQVRAQMGLPLVTLSEGSMKLNQYQADQAQSGWWHDLNAISATNSKARDDHGVGGRETMTMLYGRNYNGLAIKDENTEFTMANLKTLSYYGLVAMLFGDFNSWWGHTTTLLADMPTTDHEYYYGWGIDKFGNIHMTIYASLPGLVWDTMNRSFQYGNSVMPHDMGKEEKLDYYKLKQILDDETPKPTPQPEPAKPAESKPSQPATPAKPAEPVKPAENKPTPEPVPQKEQEKVTPAPTPEPEPAKPSSVEVVLPQNDEVVTLKPVATKAPAVTKPATNQALPQTGDDLSNVLVMTGVGLMMITLTSMLGLLKRN